MDTRQPCSCSKFHVVESIGSRKADGCRDLSEPTSSLRDGKRPRPHSGKGTVHLVLQHREASFAYSTQLSHRVERRSTRLLDLMGLSRSFNSNSLVFVRPGILHRSRSARCQPARVASNRPTTTTRAVATPPPQVDTARETHSLTTHLAADTFAVLRRNESQAPACSTEQDGSWSLAPSAGRELAACKRGPIWVCLCYIDRKAYQSIISV